MMTSSGSEPIVISSPIEFLVIGAAGEHDQVLVRSENCQLDLIGFAQQAARGRTRQPFPRGPFDMLDPFTSERDSMQSVDSLPLKRGSASGDARASIYTFCWVGYAGASYGIRMIEEAFQRQAFDLDVAMENGAGADRIAWVIAPVIFQCSAMNIMRRSRKRQYAVVMILYLLIGLVAVAIYASWRMQFMN